MENINLDKDVGFKKSCVQKCETRKSILKGSFNSYRMNGVSEYGFLVKRSNENWDKSKKYVVHKGQNLQGLNFEKEITDFDIGIDYQYKVYIIYNGIEKHGEEKKVKF